MKAYTNEFLRTRQNIVKRDEIQKDRNEVDIISFAYEQTNKPAKLQAVIDANCKSLERYE